MVSDVPVEAEDLTKRFGNVIAVEGISFSVKKGSVVGLLGGNGAGKTTTMSLLMGLVIPSAGEARIFGEDASKRSAPALARINFSSPYVEMPGRLTVEENLQVYARLFGVVHAKERIAELARDLDLESFLHRMTRTLSAGQKSRSALAKSLINEPELLLLDEPTASLDPDTADWIRTYLQDYQKNTGAAILLASHNMPEVERLCDEVLMMRGGMIVDHGAPSELITRHGRQNLEEVFLDIARKQGEVASK
ncbi:MAG: ABC transporter ATP-binding protein [Rhodospirillales bacterium]